MADMPLGPEQTPASPPPASAAGRARTIHQVVFVGHPKLLFAWPLILAGFVFYLVPPEKAATTPAALPAAAAAPVAEHATNGAPSTLAAPASARLEWLGWAYIWIALVVVLALGIDVSRNQALVFVLVVVLVWVLGLYLRDVKHFTVFGDIYRWFRDLDVQYDRRFGLAFSLLLLIPYVLMLIWTRLNDRWRITHNEFEHYSFGKMTDSLGRGAKTIRTEFADILEFILGFGAGTLIVYNASGTRELRRIPNIPFLPFVRKKLDHILEMTSVTASQAEDEEDDDQQ